jgi:outer membrane receptor for ferrienterochelin and colicin
MKNNWVTVSLCITFQLIFGSTLSHASEEVEDYFSMTPAELAAVPVTIATGTPRPNFKSAGSTSVITEEQIRSMGATELHEIMETVPGIHTSLQPITNDYNYTVRGIANQTNSQMLILLNGTRITSPFQGSTASSLDLPVAAIQRVEVVRGPGSAVYGADAFAGVINVITKKANDIDGTQLGVRAGNWDSQSGWGQHGGHWAGWNVAASIQYQHTQGDLGRILQEDTQTINDRALGTKASLAPGPMNTRYKSLNTHLNLQRKHWDIGFWAFNGFDTGTRIGGAGALDPKGVADNDQYLGDIRFSTEDWFDDWEFLAHLSYLHSDVSARVNLFPDNAVLPIGVDGEIAKPGNRFSPVLFPDGVIEGVRHVQRIPSFELSSVYKGLAKHLLRFSAGFRYEEIVVYSQSNYGYGVLNWPNLPAVVDGSLTDKTGKYAFLKDTNRAIGSLVLQDEWQIADDWHLTAGLRYDQYSDFGSTFNPRFALAWDINEQLTSKLLYGKAFRAPSFTELGTQNNPVLLGNPNLKPELINTVEWAFDYRPFSSFRTGLNLYYYHISDLITTRRTGGKNNTISIYDNFGNQDGYGTELEWNWKVTDQWSLAGNYAWQHTHSERTKSSVSGVPDHHVYLASIWQFMPNWQFQSQLNWVGGRTRDAKDTRPLNDYETVDFTLNGKKLWGHVNLAASLRNVFNNRGLEPARPELPMNVPLAGRSFYFQASVDF